MCHLQAMPGDPYYDDKEGMEGILEKAKHDLIALQEGGVDGIIFSNEFSLPYLTKVKNVTSACMASIVGQLKREISVPFGINALWDPQVSIDIAKATGGKFVREIFTGVYASDFGMWDTNCGDVVRHQRSIDASDVKLFFNIVPEAAKYLGDRDIESVAKSTVFNSKPDALCVSGLTAGTETNTETLIRVKSVVKDTVVFVNTGCNVDNITRQLSVSDGAIVATTFKFDGVFENLVDVKRVKEFMAVVKEFRQK